MAYFVYSVDAISFKLPAEKKIPALQKSDLSISSSLPMNSFSTEYSAAVEAKQVAKQQAERAELLVDKAIQEKNAKIVRAEGESKSAELIGKSIAENPGFLNLQKIEAAKEISHMVASSSNRVYLDSSQLLLNLQGSDVEVSTLDKDQTAAQSGYFN